MLLYEVQYNYILLVSDRCYAREAEDSSGPNLKRILSEEAKCVSVVCAVS